MTTNDFVATFKGNTETDRIVFLKEHVVNQYVPFLTKVAECKRIVQATSEISEIGEDGKPKNVVFSQSTPMRYLIFTMTLIRMYTDIEYEDANIADSYDKLAEAGIINKLSMVIPKSEFEEFNTILNMGVSDYFENNRSMVSVFGALFKETK